MRKELTNAEKGELEQKKVAAIEEIAIQLLNMNKELQRIGNEIHGQRAGE